MQDTSLPKSPSFREMLKDQDTQQKMNVAITLVLEVYRVLMGAMLVLFVPQNCDGRICTLSDNFDRNDGGLTKGAFGINMLTVFAFLILYKFEVSRENKMIDYLNVNSEKPRDNEAVEEALQLLESSKKEELWRLDSHYQKAGYFCMGAFGLNSIISLVVIFNNYLSDKTITVLITNLLFLSFKIKDVFAVVNTEKSIFLSSYLTRKIQFNDVDPDHIYTALCSDIESADITDITDITENISANTKFTENPSIELLTHIATVTTPTPPTTPIPTLNVSPLIIPNPP